MVVVDDVNSRKFCYVCADEGHWGYVCAQYCYGLWLAVPDLCRQRSGPFTTGGVHLCSIHVIRTGLGCEMQL